MVAVRALIDVFGRNVEVAISENQPGMGKGRGGRDSFVKILDNCTHLRFIKRNRVANETSLMGFLDHFDFYLDSWCTDVLFIGSFLRWQYQRAEQAAHRLHSGGTLLASLHMRTVHVPLVWMHAHCRLALQQ